MYSSIIGIISLIIIITLIIRIYKDKKTIKEAHDILKIRPDHIIAPEVIGENYQKFCYDLYNDDNFIFLVASLRENIRNEIELCKDQLEINRKQAMFVGLSLIVNKVELEARRYINRVNPKIGK